MELPQIPKSIAKMAAEAKHEIQIERAIDKKRKAAAAAKTALAKKAHESKKATKAAAAHPHPVPAAHPHAAAKAQHKVSKTAARAKLVAKQIKHAAKAKPTK